MGLDNLFRFGFMMIPVLEPWFISTNNTELYQLVFDVLVVGRGECIYTSFCQLQYHLHYRSLILNGSLQPHLHTLVCYKPNGVKLYHIIFLHTFQDIITDFSFFYDLK